MRWWSRGTCCQRKRNKFLVIADAGSAAAHRAHVPDEKTLDSVLSAVEALLYRLYVLPGEVKEVEASTPKRPSLSRPGQSSGTRSRGWPPCKM